MAGTALGPPRGEPTRVRSRPDWWDLSSGTLVLGCRRVLHLLLPPALPSALPPRSWETPGSSGRPPKATGCPKRLQEAQRSPKKLQELARSSRSKRLQEVEGGSGSLGTRQEALGWPRRPRETPGSPRAHQLAPGTPRKSQEAEGGPTCFRMPSLIPRRALLGSSHIQTHSSSGTLVLRLAPFQIHSYSVAHTQARPHLHALIPKPSQTQTPLMRKRQEGFKRASRGTCD